MGRGYPKPTEMKFHLDLLVERAADGWQAHCLQLDLVAEGKTADEAINDLLNVIDVQIRTCLQNGNIANLYFPAPKEAWGKLAQARAASKGCKFKREERPLPDKWNEYERMEVDQYCYA